MRRALDLAVAGAGDEVVDVEVIVVRMRLDCVSNPGERDGVDLAGGEQVRPEVDQEDIVDQRRCPLAERLAADPSGGLAVVAAAERIGVAFRGGGSEECDLHAMVVLSKKCEDQHKVGPQSESDEARRVAFDPELRYRPDLIIHHLWQTLRSGQYLDTRILSF